MTKVDSATSIPPDSTSRPAVSALFLSLVLPTQSRELLPSNEIGILNLTLTISSMTLSILAAPKSIYSIVLSVIYTFFLKKSHVIQPPLWMPSPHSFRSRTVRSMCTKFGWICSTRLNLYVEHRLTCTPTSIFIYEKIICSFD